MLSEISQSQRNKLYVTHLCIASRVVKFIEAGSEVLLPRRWGKEKWRII
jgi:hypothetical protein